MVTYNTAANQTVATVTQYVIQELTFTSLTSSGCAAGRQILVHVTRDTSVGSNYGNPWHMSNAYLILH